MMLKALRGERCAEGSDTHRLILIEQLNSHRTAPKSEFGSRNIVDTQTSAVPDADPRRLKEVDIDTPFHVVAVGNREPVRRSRLHEEDHCRSIALRLADGAALCDARRLRVFLTHNPEDLDAYYQRALPELTQIADVVVNPLDRDLTTGELIEESVGCEVIIAHRSTAGEAELFAARPELLAFLRCAVDISTIDVDAASTNGVLIAQADKSFVASTAELALALYLDAVRHVASSTCDYRGGIEPSQRPGRQVKGKTAGIIGFGAVGSYLAQLLHALGLTVVVHDPFVEVPAEFEQLALDPVLQRSDVVFPLAPAVPATENFIGPHELATMKRGATLVNVSRGELLDEAAVGDALDSGHLGALAMDVGRAPDQRPSQELARRPGVVATPHLGGLTPENADAQALSSVEQVQAMSEGQMPPRAVNPNDATRLEAFWAGQ